MPVTHFITHQIDKDPKAAGALVKCSEKDDFKEDHAAKVMAQLRNIFIGRASKRYGEFGPEAPQFKGLMLDWLNNKQSFVSLTQRITKLFAEKFDNTQHEVDGYLAFMAEQLADGDRFYVYHLREKSNVALSEDGELTETRFIDFSNTGFALCLDTTALQQGDAKKYLSFSYGRGEKAVQNLFCEFCGFSDTVNVEQETQEFLKIVEAYTKELPEEKANETRTKVVEFCMEQDKYGAAVEFKALSNELDEQAPQKFEQFVQQKRQEIRQANPEQSQVEVSEKTEFIPDRKSLKNYIRYSGKNKDVTLSFSAMALGGDVQFNQSNNSLMITNLPARLLKQLKQEADFEPNTES
jgi:nucleoid-associated protein